MSKYCQGKLNWRLPSCHTETVWVVISSNESSRTMSYISDNYSTKWISFQHGAQRQMTSTCDCQDWMEYWFTKLRASGYWEGFSTNLDENFRPLVGYRQLYYNTKFWRAPIGGNRSLDAYCLSSTGAYQRIVPVLAVFAQNLALGNKNNRVVNINFPRATYHTIVPSPEELYCLNRLLSGNQSETVPARIKGYLWLRNLLVP